MSTRPIEATSWPNQQQELLLRASLLTGDEALEAWHHWKLSADINQLDPGSYRLLPRLYHNLKTECPNDPLMAKLKGIYCNTWYKNQLLFHHAATVLNSWHQAGVETMSLKGVALVPLYYRDPGLRHMDDIDVLVHPQQALTAMRVLKESGWKPSHKYSEAWLTYEHAAEFRDDGNRNLDLHWGLLWDGRADIGDDDFWDAAVRIEISGIETLALNASDQVLHVCVHGANWNVVPPLRWVADAMTIMQSSRIDWNRLIEQAQKRRLTLLMSATLEYLRRLLDAPVPSLVLQALRDTPVSYREKFFFNTRTRSHTALRRLPVMWHWFESFRAEAEKQPLRPRLANLLEYLQSLWRVEHLWQVPLHVVYKAARAGMHLPYWYLRNKLTRRRGAFSQT